MLLPHLRDLILRESFGYADKGRPKSAMNQGYLPSDQPAYEDIVRFDHCLKDREDFTGLWMTPPAACNRFANDCLSQPGHRTFARYEHDPVLLHERLCLINGHDARVRAACEPEGGWLIAAPIAKTANSAKGGPRWPTVARL
jgi:hypothetical protein